MGYGVWGLGFGVWGLGFGVWGLGLGFGVWGLGYLQGLFLCNLGAQVFGAFRVLGLSGFREVGVWGSWGLELRVLDWVSLKRPLFPFWGGESWAGEGVARPIAGV